MSVASLFETPDLLSIGTEDLNFTDVYELGIPGIA